VLLATVGLASAACSSIPPGQSAVDHVRIEGSDAIASGDIENKIATTPSPKFLELFQGVVYDYELFDRYVLAADLARTERFYRTRGFYEAHARAGRVEQHGKHVQVTIVVEEGPATRVRNIRLDGMESLPEPLRKRAIAAVHDHIKPGERFDEEHFKQGDAFLTHTLTDSGYAFANVDRKADVDVVTHTADVVYTVSPDEPSHYGKVTIEGLGSLPDGPVRRALDIEPGKPYSRKELNVAQQAALDLGVFSSVEVTPELTKPPPADRVVPVHVKVQPTRLRGVKLGGGFELDVIKTDVHALLGWEDRNFLGGMRHLTVEARPGAVLFPTRLSSFVAPTSFLPELRTRMHFRQPGFIEGRTGGLIQAEFNVGPILLTQDPPASPVLGYREAKGAIGLDRVFHKLYVKLTQNVQDEFPFAYIGSVDPALSQVIIAYPELVTTLDLRDDKYHPHRGLYLTDNLQVAGDGGSARDVRVLPEARGYIPIAKGVTLAGRATLGFLFPFNYGGHVDPTLPTGQNVTNVEVIQYEQARTAWVKDAQVVFFRGFFSGGPSSNRGYPLFGVGPHGPAPFYNQTISFQQAQNGCTPTQGSLPPPQCYVPLGGSTLWEASVEFRFHITGPFELATFCDAGDVSSQRVDVRLDKLHLSCGAGARYDTPVGPIRLDIGYRIPGLQYPGQGNPAVDAVEGNPGTIFGIPIAIAFGIGESY
jgi:outer membrane protein assembly factor BamA